MASLAYTLYEEIWSFESVDSIDIKSVFVCDVCDRFSLLFLMSAPISLQVSSNIPGYVSSFISTLFMKVHRFFFGWSGGPVLWTSYLLCSVFVGFLCHNFCYKGVLDFCGFFLFSWGYLFILLIRESTDMAFIRLDGKRNI